jgi:type IV pilus assembly protein PilC
LADLLDKGLEPKVAAAQSGLPKPVVDLLDVAISSDDFAGTFDELAKLEMRRSLTIHRVVQALAYPMLLFVCCVLSFVQMLVTTVPGFEEIFKDCGAKLPEMTEWVLQLSRMARSPLSLLGLGAFALTLFVAIKVLFPRFWFCMPVFGNIGRCLYTARMLRQMANQVARNVPLPEALEHCGKSMRNSAYRDDCRSAAAASRKGMSFAEIVLRYYWLFPAWLAPMVAVENVRESLSKSLRRAADTVDQQQDVSVLLLQTISLPLFIMIMFTVVGFFIITMFMPLIDLINCMASPGGCC